VQLEHLILLLTFIGIFIFVLWSFPSERHQDSQDLPWWLVSISPLAELFSRDIGQWLESSFYRRSSKLRNLGERPSRRPILTGGTSLKISEAL
jgi:hypothetical protein